MSGSKTGISILGIHVADLAFRANRLPRIGETLLGSGFATGPGGKGSNPAVAAARAGTVPLTFITTLGRDAFADIGLAAWRADGISTDFVRQVDEEATRAAFIFVSAA
jgi:ribokinase